MFGFPFGFPLSKTDKTKVTELLREAATGERMSPSLPAFQVAGAALCVLALTLAGCGNDGGPAARAMRGVRGVRGEGFS